MVYSLFLFFLSFLSPSLLQARKLEMKERELATISSFYKEQLEILEKKVKAMSLSHKHDCYCISILATLTLVYCLKNSPEWLFHLSTGSLVFLLCFPPLERFPDGFVRKIQEFTFFRCITADLTNEMKNIL